MQSNSPYPDATVLATARQDVPWLSVVVPTYNCAACLPEALASLARQTERDFEVVISDGASTDETRAIAEAARAGLPSLKLLSRPDQGVYDAINLAVQASSGAWVYVMGSDDRLHADDTLTQARRLMEDTQANLVYGDVRVLGANQMVEDGGRYGGPFTLARLMGQNICQQAIFYRRSLFETAGLFDVRFRLWADWDFAQRVFATQPAQWLNLVVADYAATGMSTGTLDKLFMQTQRQRLFALWRASPFNLAVPQAVFRQAYWDWRKRRAI